MCKMNNTLDNGDNKTVIIAGGSFGALVVFLIMLTVVGATICIKKGIYFKFFGILCAVTVLVSLISGVSDMHDLIFHINFCTDKFISSNHGNHLA